MFTSSQVISAHGLRQDFARWGNHAALFTLTVRPSDALVMLA
jgi:hypothetical protein